MDSLKGSHPLSTYDARIIECHYCVLKLDHLVKYSKALQIRTRTNDPNVKITLLVDFIAMIAGSVMNVDPRMSSRLVSISKLVVPMAANSRVNPSLNTNVTSFEVNETDEEVKPLNYDNVDTSALCQQLIELFEHGKALYQKKLQLLIKESNVDKSLLMSKINVLASDIINPLEIEVITKLYFTNNNLKSAKFRIITIIIEFIKKSLQNLKPFIDSLKSYKVKPMDTVIRHFPNWDWTLHRILIVLLRLNDLYTILRSIGRFEYLSNYEYLHSNKTLYNQPNLNRALAECETWLKGSRNNQQLIFIISKLSRSNSNLNLNKQNLLEISSSILVGYGNVMTLVGVTLNFIKYWEIAETSKKNSTSSSATTSPNLTIKTKNLNRGQPVVKSPQLKKLEFSIEKHKQEQEHAAKLQREREHKAHEERLMRLQKDKQQMMMDEESTRKRIEEREKELRNELAYKKNGPRSRSNSNSSVSSTNSLNSLESLSIIDSPSRGSSSPQLSRNGSIIRRNSILADRSSAAFDIRSHMKRNTANNTNGSASVNGVITRPRSRSLQQEENKDKTGSIIVAAAMNASKLNKERHSSLKSTSEIERLRLKQKQQQSQRQFQQNYYNNYTVKQVKKASSSSVDEPQSETAAGAETESEPPKLKLSIPNNNSTPLKSVMKSPLKEIKEVKDEPEAPETKAIIEQIEVEIPTPEKKVRFTGVPAYTSAEDAKPTKKGWLVKPANSLIQQESMTFHNLKNVEVDLNSGQRLVSQMNASRNKWKLSHRLK